MTYPARLAVATLAVATLAVAAIFGDASVAGAQGAARAGEPRVVALDPGHPSETSAGTSGLRRTREAHVAWQVALRLRRRLEARGYTVVVTKARERQFVRNRDRARTANAAVAALFVRLHCDAGKGRGFALYYPDRLGTVEGHRGPAPDIRRRSREAADSLHAAMAAGLADALQDGGVRGDSQTYVGARQGALTGSIYSEVPVVTVEMAVLSDPADAAFIRSSRGQERMAAALAAGVGRYLP